MHVEDDAGNCIEPAKSGRSRCRSCRATLDKNALRFGRPNGIDGWVWYHPVCAGWVWPREVSALLARVTRDGAEHDAVAQIAAQLTPGPVDLAEALDHGRAGRWADVAAALRHAWWSSRDRRIAALLAALTHDEVARLGGIPSGKKALATFVDDLRDDALHDGVRILAASRATKSAMPDALAAALVGFPDPRWVDLVLPWFADPPWQNAGLVWGAVQRLLDRLADPRSLEVVRELRTVPLMMRFGWEGAYELERWVRERDDGWFAAALDDIAPLSEPVVVALSAIETLATRRRESAAGDEARKAEIYATAARGDDAALLVLADLFASDGDLRGEYLQLQLGTLDRAAKMRRRELEQKHWRALLGGLAAVVRKRGLVLERGLPVEVVAAGREPGAIEAARTAFEWAGVRRLELAPPAGGHEGVVSLVSPLATGLVEILAEVGPRSLHTLLFEGPPMPSVRRIIATYPYDPSITESIGRTGPCRFENLEQLVIPPGWRGPWRRGFEQALPGVAIAHQLPRARR